MGCTQSAWPLWAANISFSRQIGSLGATQGVNGTGFGDQLYQIFASSCARAEPATQTSAAKASAILRYFMKTPPQTYVLFGERMSQIGPLHNRSNNPRQPPPKGVVSGGNFSSGRVWMKVRYIASFGALLAASLLAAVPTAQAQVVVTMGKGLGYDCFLHAKAGTNLQE